ncbi:hypothetical protein CH379_009385 [Leptospira ellisii]|uniref:Uncharacterized protein n=1 Tax=Leptospira ellisii TaxID=2023197 RepID=A0A2N0BM48_9LEPT|nr:hypothetical protein [Leptospira ellisii]MDV6235838.1 hypothetical protein [Leptospira ellisii]PJZ91178.1 hypothetical protein CH379_20110 [Leptospira ellisii]PKA05066.1 hypothetical protein CH375_07230 [Leptospira ellisii]
MFPLRAKQKIRLHSILGISSIILLGFRLILQLLVPLLSEHLALTFGRIGIILGVFAFFSGAGLGRYRFVENSKYAELHVILLLAGLALQVPGISESHSNPYALAAAWFGYPLLIAGWIYGRRIRENIGK